MTGPDPQPLPSPEASRDAATSQPGLWSFETYRSVLRLLVGIVLIGGDDLLARLRAWEDAHPALTPAVNPPEPGFQPTRDPYALLGMAFDAPRIAARAFTNAAARSASLAGSAFSVFSPITGSALFRPLRSSLAGMAERSKAALESYAQAGRVEAARSRALAADVTGLLIEDVVDYVGDNPGIRKLIDEQVAVLLPVLVSDATIQQLLVVQLGTWINTLSEHPESLDPLVREVGDRYIAYLNEHPEDVQNLVQGQAIGMASEVRDSVRTITVTGDTALEMLVRSILRRPPREQLPPPNTGRRNGSDPQAGEGAQ